MLGTAGWTPQFIDCFMDLCVSVKNLFIHNMQKTAAGTLDTAGASSSGGGETPGWIESFDPLRVREQESHKIVLRRLVIACIAVCLLSSVSYATVCGTELCHQFYDGVLSE